MIEKVLLVGLTGAGKSSVGAALSARLGWTYVDDDSLLERTAGSNAGDLLAARGEQALREAESRVLTVLLALPGPMVGGVPADVVLDEPDRSRLAAAPCMVVWLRVSPQVLSRRLGKGAGRAWPGADPVAVMRRLAAERNGFYAEVADHVIDVDALPVGAIAKLVAQVLEVDAQP